MEIDVSEETVLAGMAAGANYGAFRPVIVHSIIVTLIQKLPFGPASFSSGR